MSDVAERVKKIVVEHLGVEGEKVIDTANFIEDLGADSLDTVELVMAFEEEFGVEIPADAAETIARLTATAFTVTPQRDRMAMMLGGVELPAARGHDIVSDATVAGSIQVPGSRRPIVLMADSQTTGGYPKIATVISTDLPRLAQMPAGTRFRFAVVSRDEGEAIWIAHRRAMRAMLEGLQVKPEGELTSEYLLSRNLIGGIFAYEKHLPAISGENGEAK